MMKILSKNKKAYHDYEILTDYEAGLVLQGPEVKSIKEGKCNLKGSYLDCTENAAWIKDMHVSRYSSSHSAEHDPLRKRKLLLHKNEIAKIQGKISEKGITAVPLEIYLKKNIIKVKIGICKGRKLHDKRQVLKKRAQDLEIRKSLKRYNG